MLKSKFEGYCGICGGKINIGDEIEWSKGERSKHVVCAQKAKSVTIIPAATFPVPASNASNQLPQPGPVLTEERLKELSHKTEIAYTELASRLPVAQFERLKAIFYQNYPHVVNTPILQPSEECLGCVRKLDGYVRTGFTGGHWTSQYKLKPGERLATLREIKELPNTDNEIFEDLQALDF